MSILFNLFVLLCQTLEHRFLTLLEGTQPALKLLKAVKLLLGVTHPENTHMPFQWFHMSSLEACDDQGQRSRILVQKKVKTLDQWMISCGLSITLKWPTLCGTLVLYLLFCLKEFFWKPLYSSWLTCPHLTWCFRCQFRTYFR